MAKRYTDTEKWKDEWFLSLNNDWRQIWLWLLDNCNHAGLCKRSITLLNMMCNTKITEDDLLEVFQNRILIYHDYWFIPKFIFFQYGNDFINSGSKPVQSAIKSMLEYGIMQYDGKNNLIFSIPLPNPYHTLIKPLPKGLDSAKDKDKDKDKALDKEKELGMAQDDLSFNQFQSYFPNGKNSVTHNEIAIWNSLGTQERQICLQLTPMYVQHHLSRGNEKFIKNIKNFLNEGFWNQLFQFQTRYLGKKVELKTNLTGSDKSRDLTIEEQLSMLDNL